MPERKRKKARRRFGSIRELPSGRHQVRYRGPDGKLITASMTFATKTDAEKYLTRVEADQLRDQWTDPRLGKTTFAVWAERWEASTLNLRPSTRALYATLLRLHILPTFGSYPLTSIDVMAVRTWLRRMEANGVGTTTRVRSYQLLNRVMSSAVEARYIAANPCAIRGAAREEDQEMRIATLDQVGAITSGVPHRYKAMILVTAFGGLRWGELAGLRRHRIDLATGTVVVAEQLLEVRGQFSTGPVKSRAGQRAVVLPGAVVQALAEHLARYVRRDPDALVFVGEKGARLRRSNFNRRVWAPAVTAAGVPELRFHDLRHTAGTLATAAGASLREVMARLGHSTVAAALRYQHVMSGRDATIAQALDKLLRGHSGTDVARDGDEPSGESERHAG
jgi:integrase